ncbi:hypothetical protein GCM10011309_12100 [Litorimonas cladophorae]|uniref:Uncharacterized protein n=1 Tax=Litorimonas cladophorae TaxID=1220491 RepID=A0A918NFJ1_9PROT|nr:hypothetical protein [Litorimonas cladophorae]GGX63662.1 hypothetical protein GCM10011309_12100 [Litorimonas cladophorae]
MNKKMLALKGADCHVDNSKQEFAMRRIIFVALSLSLSLFLLTPEPVAAQDEIVVTGSRISRANKFEEKGGAPGVTVIKRGDFLLLEVFIESDARDETERLSEIAATIDRFIGLARADTSIELSIVESGTTVRNLTTMNYQQGISRGGRPDTSIARIRVKTAIPEQVENSANLAGKLSRFVDKVDEKGRITISTNGETAVSVVDPYQYRNEVVAEVVKEIKTITETLGPEYVAIIEGLDRQVYWDRKGDIDLAFSLPYTYEIIPNTLHSKWRMEYED